MSCVNWCNFEGTIPPKTDSPISNAWEIELSTFSNYARNQILGIFEGTTPNVPTQFYVAAHSTACTAAAPGTELTGDNYERFAITFERVSDIKRWNPEEVSSVAATPNSWTVLSLSIWDAQTGGNYWAFGNLTSSLTVATNSAIVLQANRVIVGMGSSV